MPEKGTRWRRFQAVKKRNISKRAKRAEGATMRHAHRFLVGRWDNIRGVRRHILTWMIGVAGLIMIVGVQMLWFQRSYLQSAPVNGGVYAEAVIGPVSNLNPLYATTDAELAASKLIFSSLYNYDSTGHLRGDIARSMKMEPNGKSYTLTLKPNLQWQDGHTLTAKDIVFTVNLMKNPSAKSVMSASWKDITATEVDKTTVKFTLPAAYAAFPQALTFSVLPSHLLSGVDPRQLRENSFSSSPLGSGPFTLRLAQTINPTDGRKVIHMAANDKYYGGKPRLDRFQLHVYGTMDNIASALRTGEVSAAADVSGDVARSVEQSRYIVREKPVNSGVYAILNTSQPVLKDVMVRRALQLATDTKELRSTLYGKPNALSLPFVDGQLSGAGVPSAPQPNMSQAMALLDTAGWKSNSKGIRSKDDQELKLRVVTRKNSDYEKILANLKGQWSKIGVSVQEQIVDPNAVDQSFTQTILQPRNYDVLLDELLIGGDPDVFAYWHSRGLLNFANYSNTGSDDNLVSGRDRSEPEVRNVKYKAFASQWLEDVPAIGLYQSSMLYVQSKQSQSITDDEKIITPSDRYADVQYWTSEQGNVYKTP